MVSFSSSLKLKEIHVVDSPFNKDPKNIAGVPIRLQHVWQTLTLYSVHQNCSVMAQFKAHEVTHRIV